MSIGEDGPSQMALEDLAEFRAVHSSVGPVPVRPQSDGRARPAMADHPGISYLRTTRGAYATIYGPDDAFAIGGSPRPARIRR